LGFNGTSNCRVIGHIVPINYGFHMCYKITTFARKLENITLRETTRESTVIEAHKKPTAEYIIQRTILTQTSKAAVNLSTLGQLPADATQSNRQIIRPTTFSVLVGSFSHFACVFLQDTSRSHPVWITMPLQCRRRKSQACVV